MPPIATLAESPNRYYAEQRLAAEIALAQRYGSSLAVLMLGLDDFEGLNTRYGHLAVDSALKKFAERVSAEIRSSDFAVRISGAEFVVLLPSCSSVQIQWVLRRLAKLQIEIGEDKITLAFTAGWTEYQAKGTIEELLQRADDLLGVEKQSRQKRATLLSNRSSAS